MRGWVGGFAISAGALLLCLLVGELGMHMLGLGRALDVEIDPDTYWRYAPNQEGFVWMGGNTFPSPPIHINQLGLRGDDVVPGDARRRILLLGDSHTFGVGVRDDQTFGAVLERALGSDTVHVINAGVPGFGIFQMAALFRRLAPLLRPDVVIVTIPSCDLLRQPFATPAAEARYLDHLRRTKDFSSIGQFPALLYRWIAHIYARNGGESGTTRPADSFDYRTFWRADAARLLEIANGCQAIGAVLIVVPWPLGQHPSDEVLMAGMRDLAAQPGVTVLGGLGAVFAAYGQRPLHIEGDGHPDAEAYDGTGRYLAAPVRAILAARTAPNPNGDRS
jgi:hypothetical protein